MVKLTTLSSRLTIWYSSAFALSIAIAFFIFYISFDTILMNRIEEDLSEDIEEFERIFVEDGLAGIEAELKRESMDLGESEKSFIQILDKNGKISYSTNTTSWIGLKANSDYFQQTLVDEEPVLYTLELQHREDQSRAIYASISPGIYVHIGESLEEKQELMAIVVLVFSGMFMLVLPIASYIGWIMAQRAVRGVNAVSKTAREIECGALDKRVCGEMWGDEVQQLANTFNAMLDRIRDLIIEMRELTDNIAHDLRSPLARIRVIAESTISHNKTSNENKSAAADIIEECDRLMEMINASLDLAEMESGAAHFQKSRINLTQLINDACELFLPLAEEKYIHLDFQEKTDYFVFGDIQRLQRMLANLLDNAIKYTPDNGNVSIDVMPDKKSMKVIIADTGLGIPADEQRKVFDRFYRCDQSRLQKGCGLGLSFARSVARAHGGDIVLNTQFNKGSIFSVSLNRD